MGSISEFSYRNALSRFTHNAATSGIVLILTTIIAIVWANSEWGSIYFELWQKPVSFSLGDAGISKPLILWINDGLMAMFFFVIGLEIKREIIAGELSTWKQASMPIFAAIGGSAIPALIFLLFSSGMPTASGWGIPMATDIAFSLGVLALLGSRVPLSLKIFLTALAIVDDLMAVLVIAFFYSSEIVLSNIIWGLGFLGVMIGMNWLGVRNQLAYAIPGVLGFWLAFLLSGIHPTIAGVMAALTIPATTKVDKSDFKKNVLKLLGEIRDSSAKLNPFLTKKEQSIVSNIEEQCEYYKPPLQALEKAFHPWVVFLIMPIFALSNAGVLLGDNIMSAMLSPVGLGISVGLVLGKPLGILLFAWIAYKLKIAMLPKNIKWVHILGVGLLAGIGFTMALFIMGLAFSNTMIINDAKISILFTSLGAGMMGYLVLYKTLPKHKLNKKVEESSLKD